MKKKNIVKKKEDFNRIIGAKKETINLKYSDLEKELVLAFSKLK